MAKVRQADTALIEYLRKAFAENKASHAYIVCAEKAHLPELLKNCAAVALCLSHQNDGCDTCKKVQSGLHQDHISFPTDKDKNKLTVADMSRLVDESVKRPIDSGDVRVFTLDASDSVVGVGSTVWQNKLLKTLEEPVEGVYLFIGVTDTESLLKTVVSRCQALKETRKSIETVKSELKGLGYLNEPIEKAAAMSGGNTENALKLLADPLFFAAFDTAERMLTEMTSTKNALEHAAALIALKDKLSSALSYSVFLLSESVKLRLCPKLCALTSKNGTVEIIAQNYTLQAAEICIELINAAQKRLSNAGNTAAETDNLLINMLEVKYRCRI